MIRCEFVYRKTERMIQVNENVVCPSLCTLILTNIYVYRLKKKRWHRVNSLARLAEQLHHQGDSFPHHQDDQKRDNLYKKLQIQLIKTPESRTKIRKEFLTVTTVSMIA